MKKRTQNKTTKRPILLVDDHPASRLGVRHMIETERDWTVCGEAGNSAAALDAAIRLSPALVITDVTMPGRSGFELIQDLAARCPAVPVLVLSMHSETTYARRALEIGARGYLMKSADGNELLRAIRSDKKHNEVKRSAYSNLAAIMGRAAVHSGKIITWDEAMASNFKFCSDVDTLTEKSPAPVRADAQGRYPTPVPGVWSEI